MIKEIVKKILKYDEIASLRKRGVKVGENVKIYNSDIDFGHGFLVSIGNNVIITGTRILTHDASTKLFLGYSKVGSVIIGNNVFIGAGTTVLPNVTIGDNVIIGTGSIVTKNIESNSVVAGAPAHKISTLDEYIGKHMQLMKKSPIFDVYWRDKSEIEKKEMIEKLSQCIGYDI